MMEQCDAYLDIETTGLSCQYADITVIGVYLVNCSESKLVQLVGEQITRDSILEALGGTQRLFTYNGRLFDLPFINSALGVDLESQFEHHDLMHDCWRCNLYGGFKEVERQLGIPRQLTGISGWDAVILWHRYKRHGDNDALDLLLRYNAEDVMNLKVLRERLRLSEKGGY